MSFTVAIPELCLIRFCVRDQTGLFSSEFVGQYILPFHSLKKGEPPRQGRGIKVTPSLSYIEWHCVSFIVLPYMWCVSSLCAQYSWILFVYVPATLMIALFTSLSWSYRPPLGTSPGPGRMQSGSSLPLCLCVVFLKHLCHSSTYNNNPNGSINLNIIPTDVNTFVRQDMCCFFLVLHVQQRHCHS